CTSIDHILARRSSTRPPPPPRPLTGTLELRRRPDASGQRGGPGTDLVALLTTPAIGDITVAPAVGLPRRRATMAVPDILRRNAPGLVAIRLAAMPDQQAPPVGHELIVAGISWAPLAMHCP